MTPPTATHPAEPDFLAPHLFGAASLRQVRHGRFTSAGPQDWARRRLVSDVVTLYVAAATTMLLNAPLRHTTLAWIVAGLFPLASLGLVRARARLDEALNISVLDTAVRMIGLVSIAAMATIAVVVGLGNQHSGQLVLRLWFFSSLYLAAGRIGLIMLQRSAARSGRYAVPTLIVGAGVVGDRIMRKLASEPRYGLRPVGFLDPDPLPRTSLPDGPFLPVMGASRDLEEAIARTAARHVILSFSSEPDHVLAAKVSRCQDLGVEVSLVPRLFELINDRSTLDHVGGMPIVSLRPTNPRSWQFAVKHAMDKGLAGLALVLLAPLLLLVAGLVKLTSSGPVLYRQTRVGRDGKVFDLLKFRSMREADPAAEFAPAAGSAPGGVEGLDRRTSIGKLLRASSIDELPQIINVLRGDMSLVGPRPERPEFVKQFTTSVARYDDRHRVKSGITGWAQVRGLRGQTPISDRVEWDNFYIQNWSLRLDLRILALTVTEVFRFRG